MTDLTLRYILLGEDKSASSTASKVGGAFSKMGATIGGEFGTLLETIGQKFDALDGKQASFGQKLMGAGGLSAGIGTALSLIGSADKQAEDQLKAAVDASGNSFEDYKGKIDDAIKKQEGFNHSAVDTQGALQKLTQATNDPQKALNEMGLVADLAAAKHISLSDAAGMVAKILNGGGQKALKEFGVSLTKNKDGTVDATGALEKLGQKLDGQADASVDNFAGKIGVLRTKLGDWTAHMGEQFGPALQAAGVAIMATGTIVEIFTARQAAAALATDADTVAQSGSTIAKVAGTVATGAAAAATGVWTAAQWLLNAALDANPIGLIVLAIAALVGGIILAYNKVGWFHDGVDTAMKGIQIAFGWITDAASTAWNWIKDHWQLILDILTGPFGIAVGLIAGHWDSIKSGAKTLIDDIKNGFSVVSDIISAPFRAAFNIIKSAWNSTVGGVGFTIPGWVQYIPGMGGLANASFTIPRMASGGIVSSPTLALIGEAGPEAVVPLSGGGFGGPTIHIHTNAVVTDGRSLAQMVDTAFAEASRRGWRPTSVAVS